MISKLDLERIHSYLENERMPFDEGVSMREFSYFKSGGEAKLIVYPENEEQLQRFVEYMFKHDFEYKVIGDTSNLLFLDDKLYGVLLSLREFDQIHYDRERMQITVQSGYGLPDFSRRALLWGLEGFEGLEGIPGSIGGGMIMNAGAYGSEMKDHLIKVSGFTIDGSSFELSKAELALQNRNSLLREKGTYIVTSVVFRAVPGDRDLIFKKMEIYHAKRHKYQDFLYPTLGSIFSTQDLYHAIGHADSLYMFKLKWMRRIFYSKKIRRETPINRKKLNQFVCRYFGWNFDEQPFSDKTMNSMTNRGQHTDEFLRYIDLLRSKLPSSVRIENEVMYEWLVED